MAHFGRSLFIVLFPMVVMVMVTTPAAHGKKRKRKQTQHHKTYWQRLFILRIC
jgi:hypothetical protein